MPPTMQERNHGWHG